MGASGKSFQRNDFESVFRLLAGKQVFERCWLDWEVHSVMNVRDRIAFKRGLVQKNEADFRGIATKDGRLVLRTQNVMHVANILTDAVVFFVREAGKGVGSKHDN